MSEVDDIEARLRDPVNSWLNGHQQTDFARLVALARQGESVRTGSERMLGPTSEMERRANAARSTPVYDRPPTPPVMRNG